MAVLQRSFEQKRELRDPSLIRAIFSSTWLAPLWLVARLYLGYQWLMAGSHKVWGEGRWIAVLSLRGVSDPQGVADAIAKLNAPGVAFVDLKTESDRLLQTYQREAVTLASVGSLVVLALLFVSLRSLRRVLVVAVPLAAAVLLTAALLTAGGGKLSIFNLVGLLLIVAVGSNYCLFFERQGRDPNHRDRSVASLVLANLCTVLAFGLLSLSGIPVLHDIGVTVAVGTLLSLVLAAILSGYGEAHGAAAVADSDRRPAG